MTTPEQHIDQIINESVRNMEVNRQMEQNSEHSGEEQPDATLDSESVNVFNQALNQYLRIDEEIKTLMEAIKSRNQVKKKLGESISSFLKTNKIARVDLDGSYKGKRLESVCKETVIGFNKNNIVSAIHDELKDDTELFDKIMQALQRVSVMKEVWRLKVIQEKKQRSSQTIQKKTNPISQASNMLDTINI